MTDDILKFLSERSLCTVSTVNGSNKPEAALVGFSETSDLKIYFGTSKLTRKYKNIQSNKAVAIVVADEIGEVQYEGTAREITDLDEKQKVEQRHLLKVPGASRFAGDENQVYFEVSPTWLRFIKHTPEFQLNEMTEF